MSEHDENETHDEQGAAQAAQPDTTTYLSLDAIRAADDTKYEDVPTPEWGGKVRIRSITKGEHQAARRGAIKRGELNTDLLELNLIVAGLVEPKVTADDAALLRRKNAGVVERVLGSIMTLSGLTQEAQDDVERQFRD